MVTAARSPCCLELSRALRDGFVVVNAAGARLADLVTPGPTGAANAGRAYGPAIFFCPFCSASLAPAEPTAEDDDA